MALLYEDKEKVLHFKEEKPTVHVISLVETQQVTFEKLLDETAHALGVGRPQLKASVEAVLDRMTLFMDYGMSVKLGDFGTFKPTIKVKAQASPEDLGVHNIVRKKIQFIPGKRFKKMLSEMSVTRAASSSTVSNGNGSGGGDNPGGNDDDWQDPDA